MEETPVEKSSPLKQIRTFQGDVAQALERQKESLVSIQQTEQLKKRKDKPDFLQDSEINEKRKYSFLLFLSGFFLILLGLLGAWFGYQEYLRKTAPLTISVPGNRFISGESSVDIDLTNATRGFLISDFHDALSGLSNGELRQVEVRLGSDKEAPLAETRQFLEVLDSRAPASLVRALDPLFMLGAMGESSFIIFKLTSFPNAFPGMLAWESEIVDDLGPLLGNAEFLKALPPESVFKDMVIKNKDFRALEPVLVYSFFDNEMLIISDKAETIQTIIDRLTREKLLR